MRKKDQIQVADGAPARVFLRSLVGILRGVSATGPMTIGMTCLPRLLPKKDRYALPHREITVHLANALGVHQKLGPEARAALINHFGYRAMAAAI
jgi:hypothetical protein